MAVQVALAVHNKNVLTATTGTRTDRASNINGCVIVLDEPVATLRNA